MEYYNYYTLDYIAQNEIRIKPKDEEEAKLVIKYLYKAGYHWLVGSQEDTYYQAYGDKTCYRIYTDKLIFYSNELENCIAPQQITGIRADVDCYGFKRFVKEETQTDTVKKETQTNTIKEEKEMLDLVKIYKERKEAQIEDNARIAKDKALDKDPTIKALRDLREKSKKSDGSYMFDYECDTPDIVKKEYDKINENEAKETRELNALIDEVNAQLGLCETYDQKIAVLKGYGILDENGRIKA